MALNAGVQLQGEDNQHGKHNDNYLLVGLLPSVEAHSLNLLINKSLTRQGLSTMLKIEQSNIGLMSGQEGSPRLDKIENEPKDSRWS